MTAIAVSMRSASKASDNGYRALADLADAAAGLEYRVIGGHMVQILLHAYPTPNSRLRGTSDADAGITPPVAIGPELRERLLAKGYSATHGNRFEHGVGDELASVDLLVPDASLDEDGQFAGRQFDVAPGLAFALNSEAVQVDVSALLRDGTILRFSIPVPNVECAVVMKALVRRNRIQAKDIADLASLLELALEHRTAIPWQLSEPDRIVGVRLDTARTLHGMADQLDTSARMADEAQISGTRLAALIRELVARPPAFG